MSHGTVIHLDSAPPVEEGTARAVVAAQLRGEAKVEDNDPQSLVSSVAEEIGELGLEPDVDELGRRYGQPSIDPVRVLTEQPTS